MCQREVTLAVATGEGPCGPAWGIQALMTPQASGSCGAAAHFISPTPHSDENPEVAVLPKDKLVSLCKCDPILKWMRSCDHILYQALVEVLIPDVLRPVPSKHSPPASPLPVPAPLQPPHRGPLRLGAPRVQ